MTAPVHADAGRTETAAARRASRFAATLEGRVLAAVVQAGDDGLTAKEAREALGLTAKEAREALGLTAKEAREALGLPVERHYSVAPRLSALKGKKLVEPTTMARDNFQAYVATPAGRGQVAA